MTEVALQHARPEDAHRLLSLYRAAAQAIAAFGGDWDDDYPNKEIVADDMAAEGLFVLREGDELCAAISLCDSEIEEAGIAWTLPAQRPCMLSRLCVTPRLQGMGLARRVVAFAEQAARSRGYDAVHLMAAKSNRVTANIYPAIGYRACGEVHLYDTDFFCFEKAL